MFSSTAMIEKLCQLRRYGTGENELAQVWWRSSD
jgi:hypothetical protein